MGLMFNIGLVIYAICCVFLTVASIKQNGGKFIAETLTGISLLIISFLFFSVGVLVKVNVHLPVNIAGETFFVIFMSFLLSMVCFVMGALFLI